MKRIFKMNMILNWLGSLPGAAAQGLVYGLAAVGIYITYKILDIADLTVDGSICTGAAVCAVMVTNGINIWIAMLCALIAGMLTGLVTGWLHTFFGIPAILAGILTQLMLWSVNLLIMSGPQIPIMRFKYGDKVLFTSDATDVYRAIVILAVFIAVVIAILYWFFGTEFGSTLRATGNNLEMSRAQGINTNLTKVFGLVLSNGIVALAGALLAQQQGVAEINMGRGAIVTGLAAIIIGEALCPKLITNFYLRLLCVVGGSIIYWFVFQTIVFIGLPNELLKMLSAIVVACFLGAPYVKKIYFSKKKKARGGKHA